jgi:hypothetical protein
MASRGVESGSVLRNLVAEDGVLSALAANNNNNNATPGATFDRVAYINSEHDDDESGSQPQRQRRQDFDEDPDTPHVSEVRTHINSLKALDYSGDTFGMALSLRADAISFFKRIIEALAILLAVKLTLVLLRANQITLYVTAVLVFLIYVVSQLTYHISHWVKWTAQERNNIPTSDVGSFERSAKEEEADAEAVLWSVRMDEGELIGNTSREVLYIVNTFLTFVLVGVILERISAIFSDGQNLFEKVVELLIFIMIIFTVFGCKSFSPSASLKSR